MFSDTKNLDINYDDIDFEIKKIIKYMNDFPGIETTECCFGHHEQPCMIWFKAETIKDLNHFIFNIFDYDWLWKLQMNLQDFPKDTPYLRMVLTSGDIKDYPTIDLMIKNLEYRFKDYFEHCVFKESETN